MDAPAMEDAARGRRGNLLMASMSKVADWIGVSAPLLDVEIIEVSSISAPSSVKNATDFTLPMSSFASGVPVTSRTMRAASMMR